MNEPILLIGKWAYRLDEKSEVYIAPTGGRADGLAGWRRVDPLTGGNEAMARVALIRAALQTAETSQL